MSAIDLARSIKKACSIEDAAPKRKHVRACIVYTWDHSSGTEFFSIVKSMPIINDDIQLFKCLILVHKVIQEGHPSALKEGIRNSEWIKSLGRVHNGTYGPLIHMYAETLYAKMKFHATHRGFNSGMFEYKEYTSLVTIADPNVGYETLLDLMDYEDQVFEFGDMLLVSIGRSRHSDCQVAALVPLVAESYGIYRFLGPMVQGISDQIDDRGAIEQSVRRYDAQHSRLFEFYADCSSIKSLTSLISLPKLSPLRLALPLDETQSVQQPVQQPVQTQAITSDQRLAIHLALQSITHFQDPVSYFSISQLANEVATSSSPTIPIIIQLTHQITTLLQRNPSPLLAQASQLYFQALLSPSQQDIINANTNLQNLLINSPAHIFDPPTPQTHTSA